MESREVEAPERWSKDWWIRGIKWEARWLVFPGLAIVLIIAVLAWTDVAKGAVPTGVQAQVEQEKMPTCEAKAPEGPWPTAKKKARDFKQHKLGTASY